MLKGGVFGFGGVGQEMTQQINLSKWHGEDVKIVAAANRGQEKRDVAKNDFGLAAYATVDELIGHGLDFMLIVSTSHAHHEAALKCAKAKIPYLIEKPIALNLKDATEIVESAEKAGIINGVNYSMRYVPAYKKMKQMVDSGQLGQVLAVWAATHRGHGWYMNGWRHRAITDPKESGGWIIHHMCHIVDWAIWMAGEVDEVYALTRSTAPVDLDSEELIFSTMKFKNGAVGTLADQIGAYRDHNAGVIGTKGGVGEMNDGVKKLLRLHLESDREWRAPHVVDPEEDFQREDGLGHFLNCLRAKKQTNVPVRQALYSLRVCDALRRSAHEGKPVKMG